MASYKINTNINVPVNLTNATTGLAHTGVLAANVTVTVIKSDGSNNTFTPTAPQWAEQSSGAFALAGSYLLTIPAANTNLAGVLWYGVSVSGDDLFNDWVDLVASLSSDIVTLIGTPVVSVSADIAAAVTSIKGGSNKDLTQTDADVNTVITNLAAAVTSIKGPDSRNNTDVYNFVSDTHDVVHELLGLLHKNAVVANQTYNAGGRLTGATLKVYDTDAHASLNDGVTGLLKTYTIFSTYDGQSHETLYRLTGPVTP